MQVNIKGLAKRNRERQHGTLATVEKADRRAQCFDDITGKESCHGLQGVKLGNKN